MRLYIAFHSIREDRYRPMFHQVFIDDDLFFPLHSDFIRSILKDIRFVVQPFLEELCSPCGYDDICHVDDNQGSPLGNRLTLTFLENYLTDLASRYKSDPKYKHIKSFYVDRVLKELKSRVDENAYRYYYLVLDPLFKRKLQIDRLEQFRETAKQSLYNLDEPPACFFDQCLLDDIRRILGIQHRTKESDKREMQIRELF
jgi:hypothetical protein